VSQTLFKIEVFPAFALPMMSTLNWTLNRTFGTRGLGAGVGVGTGDGDGTDGDGTDGDGTGAKDGAGPKQQIHCFTPITRDCCEKKD
jgi:hypothetical protein